MLRRSLVSDIGGNIKSYEAIFTSNFAYFDRNGNVAGSQKLLISSSLLDYY